MHTSVVLVTEPVILVVRVEVVMMVVIVRVVVIVDAHRALVEAVAGVTIIRRSRRKKRRRDQTLARFIRHEMVKIIRLRLCYFWCKHFWKNSKKLQFHVRFC